MAIHEFVDSRGVRWRVWSIIPSNARAVNPELRDGWLAFDSGTERRRVGPIPKEWEQMSPERLELLCRLASPGRASDPSGIPIVPDER